VLELAADLPLVVARGGARRRGQGEGQEEAAEEARRPAHF